ncbi:MAG: alpha/beta hydrolase [Brevefilum sp.]|nr:lysophospholipase [Brevefilum sp.]MDT8381255.1 alpha/beta hydrolase [Brevefilum sp.]MDW7753837.1 alpha/beta hydrolase [Brevefilum sp.]
MEHLEGIFTGARDTRIFYQAYLPEDQVRASIIIVHGLGEHSGRYENVVNYLAPLGYALYSFDLIGHGQSDGARAFVEAYEDFSETLTMYKNKVRGWQPDKPLFLMGHSMGGLIASEYLIDHSDEFTGAVISAPLIMVPDNINKATILAGKILSRIAPNMGITAVDPSGVSRDPDVVHAYGTDPLVFHGKTTARLSAELLKAIMRVNDEFKKITVPFVVLQGSDDKLVNPRGSKMLYEHAGSDDKSMKIYDGLYHEVFNEPERDQVLADVAAWLDARL